MVENIERTDLVADIREQILYLRELGVDALDVHLVESGESLVESQTADPTPNVRSEIPKLVIQNIQTAKPVEPGNTGQSRLASLPSLASLSKKLEPVTPSAVEKKPESAAVAINNEPTTEALSESTTLPATEIIVTEQTSTLFVASPALPEPTETIEQIRAETAARTGENVRIARFARFAVGEG